MHCLWPFLLREFMRVKYSPANLRLNIRLLRSCLRNIRANHSPMDSFIWEGEQTDGNRMLVKRHLVNRRYFLMSIWYRRSWSSLRIWLFEVLLTTYLGSKLCHDCSKVSFMENRAGAWNSEMVRATDHLMRECTCLDQGSINSQYSV